MDDTQQAGRLVTKFGISREAAEKLVAANLAHPSLVRRATNRELKAAGLTRRDIAQIRLKRRG